MSDFDLDRLGDVWRQEPNPAELEALQGSADAVQRRARWRRAIDIIVSMAVSAVVFFLVLQNSKPETVAVGTFAIFFLFYSHNRQRRLREAELRSLTGTAEQMIDQSIGRLETTIRHHRTSLFALPAAFLVATLFSATADRGGRIFLFAPFRDTPWFRIIWVGSWLALMMLVILYMLLAIRRSRRELERLQAIRQSYRRESELSGS